MDADELLSSAVGLVADCGDPAFLVTMDGTIVAWNERATEFFGLTAWHACQRNCASIVRGFTAAGEVLCRRDCPVRRDLARGLVPREVELNALVDGLPSTVRHSHVHHLPIMHPDAGPVGVLHVVGPVRRSPPSR